MVLNDIIEQAAGRQSRASEQGGMLRILAEYHHYLFYSSVDIVFCVCDVFFMKVLVFI